MITMVKEMIRKTGKPALRFTATFDPPPTVYVSINVAKFYSKAMIFDLNKKVLEKPFEFNITKS